MNAESLRIMHRLFIGITMEVVISSPSIIRIIKSRRMWWVRHVAQIREKRDVYRLLIEKAGGKRPLGRPRCRRIDDIKMDLLDIGLSVVDWIGLDQDR
jgi:hypothetical protein